MTVYIVVKSNYRGDTIEEVYESAEEAEKHARRIDKPGYQGSVVKKEVKK